MKRLLALAALFPSACLIPDALVLDVLDRDDDGEKTAEYTGEFGVGTDCDDRDPTVHEGATEICGDGVDNDCDGVVDGLTRPGTGTPWYEDRDGDGHAGVVRPVWACTRPEGPFYPVASDCDDRNAAAHPGAEEVCNGFDDDCNRQIDETGDLVRWHEDADGDGFGSSSSWVDACQRPDGYVQSANDCDDTDGTVYPGATEVWYDGVDSDCRGGDDHDQDGDGARHTTAWSGDPPPDALVDCDDTNPRIYPDAPEVWYDEIDQDCDPSTEWDRDQDGHTALGAPVGTADDCDDLRYNIRGPDPWHLDGDLDGFGDPGDALASCDPLPGRTLDGRDCDDSNGSVHPGAVEVCNAADDDCDGVVDDGAGPSFWPDGDGDGLGDGSAPVVNLCERPPGYAANGDDCDDSNGTVYLGAPEQCTGRDDNCNGRIDDVTDPQYNYWRDTDFDGFGDPGGIAIPSCLPPAPTGWVRNDDDCDDTEGRSFPGNPEVCDGLDNNCDLAIDEGVRSTFWADVDGDGYGQAGTGPLTPVEACEAPQGWVSNNDDCDDADWRRAPNMPEVCDEIDNDCDLAIDEGLRSLYWPDEDNDNYGDEALPGSSSCVGDEPAGWVDNGDDCDDGSPNVHPGQQEVSCDDIDDDCDEEVDEGLLTRYYVDGDGDGFADMCAGLADSQLACGPSRGWAEDRTDCDDTNDRVKPGFSESVNDISMCDGLDNDCDPNTLADPPEACGDDSLSVTLFGSHYLLMGPELRRNLTDAESWCEDRGHHLWWVDDGDALETAFVLTELDLRHGGVFDLPCYVDEDLACFVDNAFHVGLRNQCPAANLGSCPPGGSPCYPDDFFQWYDGGVRPPTCDSSIGDIPSGMLAYSRSPRTMHALISDATPPGDTNYLPMTEWVQRTPFTSAYVLCEREITWNTAWTPDDCCASPPCSR